MGLTVGSAVFGAHPAGRHNARVDRFVLVEPLRRRVRAVRAGEVVVDSDDAVLVHVAGALPRYAFPADDVHLDAPDDPEVAGHVHVAWDAADAWYEEDERVFVHPRDPYHRIDTLASSRRVEVRLGGVELASSTRARALHETGLPVRWYVPRVDVRTSHLVRSDTVTECPYKGTAHYWSARVDDEVVADVAWSYEDDVRPEGEPVRWMLAFYDTKVEVTVDGIAPHA